MARILAAGLALLLTAAMVSAQDISRARLGPAPRVTDLSKLGTAAPSQIPEGLPPVDRNSRQAVVDFYNTVYVPALAATNDWNGSVPGCVAGTTGAAYTSATMDMVNYFRAMTGLPAAVTHEAVKDGKTQAAALMMTANNALNHTPPLSWTCYTADGADAAGHSNLALGAAGPWAIWLYVSDPGSENYRLGHRRWILYPPQVEVGTGSTGNANALWVLGPFGSRPATPQTVPWPPAGFVPYQTVYARWSFSVNTGASVSFTSATVSMARGSTPISLAVLQNENGYGDNTIGWEPSGLSFSGGLPDDAISVQVSNVLVGGVPTNYSYTVTVIDPARVPPPVFTDDPLVPRTTRPKAVHILELRQAVATLRARYGLGAWVWTDAALTPGSTVVKAVHLADLRTALAQVYVAAARPAPVYTTPNLVARSTIITATDVAELRAAVLGVW